MLLLTLFLPHILAFLAFAAFTNWEVKVNADMIKANGSADDLKHGFHQRRGWVRFWWWAGCCVAGSLPVGLADGLGPAVLSVGALGFLLGGYFIRTFNPQLNVAMGLDYKARFYASPSPTAARFPDQYVWRELRASKAEPTQENANFILQHFLNIVFAACLTGYVGLVIYAII